MSTQHFLWPYYEWVCWGETPLGEQELAAAQEVQTTTVKGGVVALAPGWAEGGAANSATPPGSALTHATHRVQIQRGTKLCHALYIQF